MSDAILVYIEQRDGNIKKAALEALSEGKRLADKTGGPLAALVIGSNISDLAGKVAAYGPDKIILADAPVLEKYSSEGYAAQIAAAVAETDPAVILLAFTALGFDLAPRVAGKLKTGLVTDCTRLELGESNLLKVTKPLYSGKVIGTIGFTGKGMPQIVSLRPNVFQLQETAGAKEPEISNLAVEVGEGDLRSKIREFLKPEVETVDITEANIIVAGGRGMKSGENFSILQDLADAIGGAVAASRSAVDAGWIDHQFQVGQTGKVVSPTLYIACGISGAIQHLAGMSSSKYIVAINKDPEAPLLKAADFSIVGDLFKVVPILTEELKKMRAEG
jgi:electron transfer flavoprotein alpha subunit